MKKTNIYLLLFGILLSFFSQAQVTGTKNIPGDYATLAVAITDLNTQGVGAGGITLNLLSGNPQTAPLGGYSITATGTVANTITITGNGNTITAPTPQTAGNLNDAIFKIIGGDYIKIQGFTMQENASNTTTTAGTNNMTEWGVAVLYASTTDGAKNVTIQNNTISLNRTYQNTFGIYCSNRHTATDVITAADISASSGANDNLKIYSNTISNVNLGICVVGSLTGAFMATGLDIGGSNSGTANTLTNYGTTGTFSAYVSVATANVNGIYVNNNLNVNISYNSVTSSAGGTTAGTLRGIVLEVTGTLPTTGTISNTINNNSVSLQSAVATGIIRGITNTLGNLITTCTINNNTVSNISYTVGGASGAIIFILSSAAALNVTINGNTLTGSAVNTTGTVTLINKTATHPANSVINVNNNVVTSFNKTGAGGTVTGYLSSGSSPINCTETNSNNNFSNITVTGATSLTVWQNNDGTSKTINGNSFTNLIGGSAGSGVTALSVAFGSSSIFNNTINTITGGGSVTGISGSVQVNQNVFNNRINGLSTTGGSIVTGLVASGGNTINYYKNKIYDLTLNNAGTAGRVDGVRIANAATTANNIYNNLIGDLKAPQTSNIDAIRGINIAAINPNTSLDIAFNSIYITASSTGANFGSSGIYHTYDPSSSAGTLNLRNNIIVNTSTPNGTGLTVAFSRSAGTDLNNYGALSNNNLFYAGTPGASRLIFYDGTNADQTLLAYKASVYPREANSITESPTFLSTTGSSSIFLHIDATVATQIEGGGLPISGIADDYDGNSRNVTTPDIGADEFAGIANDLTGPSIIYTPFTNTTSTANRTITATITDVSGVAGGAGAPLIYYRKGSSGVYFSAAATSVSDNDYTFTIDYANVSGGSVASGDIVQYYIAAQDGLGNVATVAYGGSGATPPGSVAPGVPGRYGISQTYTWQGVTSDFQVSTNWSPARTTPDVSDILVFDGGVTATTTVANIPTQTITSLVFQNNVNATLNASVADNTLTVDFLSGQSALTIQTGSVFNLGTTTALNLAYGPTAGQLGTIAGTLNINSTSSYTYPATSSVTTVSGTLGINSTAPTPITSTTTTLIFNAGATLQYGVDGGMIPLASYDASSTINMAGTFTQDIGWPNQSMSAGNLIYNSTGSAAQMFGFTGFAIAGSLTIQNTGSGSFAFEPFNTMTISGDAILNGGTWNIGDNDIGLNITGNLMQNGGTIFYAPFVPGQTWNAASIIQTAGNIDMGSSTGGLFNLTATSGNMSFAGTLNGGILDGMVLAFTGAGNQTLSTTSVSDKVGITVNKTSGNLTLLNDFAVNSGAAVTLTSGKFTVAAGKILTITPGASVTDANSTNYIVSQVSGANLGKLRYTGLGTSAQIFPIGTAANYTPVTITPTTIGATFTASVFDGATQNGTPTGTSFSSPILKNLVNATCQIDNSVVATPAAVTFGWSSGQEGTRFATLSGSQIAVARYNGAGYDAFTGTGDNTANTATASFNSFPSSFVVGANVPRVATKTFLQGSYNAGLSRHKDVTASWAAVLNAHALSQPYNTAAFGNYNGGEIVSNGFFTSTAATTDITDWILLELRDQTTPATVIARRAAFIREDGMIVDLDGASNVVFGGVPNGNYYLTIRHRNHLSVRTSVTIGVDGGLSAVAPSLYNLASSQSQAFQNGTITTNAAMAQSGSTYMLWGGNANSDNMVRASGSSTDNDYLFLMSPSVLNGNTGAILFNVYNNADMNMDGTVRASAGATVNDYLLLLSPMVLNGNVARIFTAHE